MAQTSQQRRGDRPQGRWRGRSDDSAPPSPDHAIKKLIGKLGQEDFFRLLALKRADSLAHHPDCRGRAAACDRVEARARELLAQKAAFSLKDLAVNGRDLLELGFQPGPELGRTLKELLEAVLSGQVPNRREELLNFIDYGNSRGS